jgi:hypothetical protein
MGRIRRAHGMSLAEVEREEDWLWMVAEDPAFYLKERGGA